ncbi:MAG: NAD(P)-dependent oxidoreductase, partial [Pseudomonadota bacterium]
AGAGRIINLSSAGAFGEAAFRHDILREETHADPVSLYSMTKFASERTASRMADVWGIDALSVRLSGVFGRWERRTSVRDTPSPQYQLCAAVRAGRPARIPRRDHRDWIYAPDVASAVLALIDAPRLNHRLYNVSTGERWAVFDWAEAFALHWPSFDISLTEPGERADIDFHAATDRGMLSIERLVADTGFKPAFDRDASAADYADWARGDGAGYG